MSSISKISLKATFKTEIRRFSLEKLSFQRLQEDLCKIFKIHEDIEVSYKDDEQDTIIISSDEELQEAFFLSRRMMDNPILRLSVTTKSRRDKNEEQHKNQPKDVERREPLHDVNLWYRLQHIALPLFDSSNTDDLRRARDLLLQQQALTPSHPITLYNLACIEARLGNIPTSLSYLEKAISAGYSDIDHMQKDTDLDPLRHLESYQVLIASLKSAEKSFHQSDCGKWQGKCMWYLIEHQVHHLFKSGSRDDLLVARDLLLEQAKIKPEHSFPIYNLACVEALLGNIPEAISYLERAIKLGYKDIDHMQKDSDLDTLRNLKEYKALVAFLEAQRSPPTSSVQSQQPIPGDSKQHENATPMAVVSTEVERSAEKTESRGRFAEELKVLENLGFGDREKMIFALESARGNVNQAIELLLTI